MKFLKIERNAGHRYSVNCCTMVDSQHYKHFENVAGHNHVSFVKYFLGFDSILVAVPEGDYAYSKTKGNAVMAAACESWEVLYGGLSHKSSLIWMDANLDLQEQKVYLQNVEQVKSRLLQ